MRYCILLFTLALGLALGSSAQSYSFEVEKRDQKYGMKRITWPEFSSNYVTERVLDAEYDSIIKDRKWVYNPWKEELRATDFFVLWKGGKAGLIATERKSSKLNRVLPCKYEEIRLGSALLPVKKDGRWGLYDPFRDKWALPAEYEDMIADTSRQRSMNAAGKKQGKYGLYDLRLGTWLLPHEWDALQLVNGDYAIVSGNGKKGVFRNTDGAVYRQPTGWHLPPGAYGRVDWIGSYLLTDSNGRQTLWAYDYYEKQVKKMIPFLYDSLSHLPDLSNSKNLFFLADSAGRRGALQLTINGNGLFSAIPCSYDDVYEAQAEKTLVAVLGSQKGVYNIEKGWALKPDPRQSFLRNYSYFHTLVAIAHIPGQGFTVTSNASGAADELKIADPLTYDSIALPSAWFLVAYRNGKQTGYLLKPRWINNKIAYQSAELIAREVSACCILYPIAAEERGLEIKNHAVIYFRNDGKAAWSYLGPGQQKLQSSPSFVADAIDDHFAKGSFTYRDAPILLVRQNGKYGLVAANGTNVVKPEYAGFRPAGDHTIRFTSPQPGKFRQYNYYKNELNDGRFDSTWQTLDWAWINGRKVADFDSVLEARFRLLARVNGSWYKVEGHRATPTRMLEEGDVLFSQQMPAGKVEFFEQKEGVGIRLDNKVIFPPILRSVALRDSLLTLYSVGSGAVTIPAGYILNKRFIWEQGIGLFRNNMSCMTCSGSGLVEKETTHTEQGSVSYRTKEITEQKTDFERVWNPRTNTYMDVRSSRPVTRTETTTVRSPDRTITTRVKVQCATCKGKGKTDYYFNYKVVGDRLVRD